MLRILGLAFRDVLRPELRAYLWRSVGLAVLVLMAVWAILQTLAGLSIDLAYGWLDTGLTVLAGLGLFLVAIYFVPAATSLVAGLFLDAVAEKVERLHYGEAHVGREMPVLESVVTAVQFTILVVIMNLVALALLLVPGINAIAFLVVNGYLVGREYFELAAFRHMPKDEARLLRQRHGFKLFLIGLGLAGYLAVPILNLTAPLFATAVMVHLVAELRQRESLRRPAPSSP